MGRDVDILHHHLKRNYREPMVTQTKNNHMKALMQKHNVTIEMLAQELNLSVSTINRLLMGSRSDPKLSTLKSVAKFFGVSIDELVGERPISLKPGDDPSNFDPRQALVQVPVIHWEQVKEAKSRVPKLTFALWNNWVAVTDEVGEHSYALVIKQASLPAPFYFRTVIVIDPTQKPLDSDYVLVLHNENPTLCQFILNGIEKCYQSLQLNKIFKESEIKFCGTLVRWIIPYHEKKEP